jgi:2'-5' RNA ligase
MHGLVTLLPDPYYAKVVSLWDELEARYPHFSWNIAEAYDRPQMDWAVAETGLVTPVFNVQTAGIGLFPAPVPVLFIKVARNPQLDLLHRRLWDRMQPIGKDMSAYYNPENWLPHISLAYGDLRSEQVPEVRAWLEAQDTFRWEMDINNICYIHEPEGQVGELQLNVPLQGPEDV